MAPTREATVGIGCSEEFVVAAEVAASTEAFRWTRSGPRPGLAPDPEGDVRRGGEQSLATGRHDYAWLLFFRFTLANALALALLTTAWAVGYVDTVLAADTSRLSVAIAAVFVGGWLLAGRAAILISRDLNRMRRSDGGFAGEPIDNLKERLACRVGVVRQTGSALVLLGLIGTVIGFIVALSGVKPGEAGDVAAIAPMVATMIHGMSIALYTTLVGSVLALWLTVLYRILATAASKLVCAARTVGYAR
jgi:hypothetical protein